ncbi:MAG: N-acetyltransferase [Gammaproteobacteria bacterium]|nr:N-acetyltransferase [Gammaproteobacteria bacterium]
MNISLFESEQAQQVIQLFTDVFSAAEGDEEGRVIGELAADLIADTNPKDLIGFIAHSSDAILGCIFFSWFTVPNKEFSYILSPVAVTTEHQRQGIGQKLILFGLEYLKNQGASLVFTYGDPAYYSQVGFEKISEDMIQAPFPLSQPIGWLAQSLDGKPLQPMQGPTQCVDALSHAKYW